MLDRVRLSRFARLISGSPDFTSLAQRVEDAVLPSGMNFFTMARDPFGHGSSSRRAWLTDYPRAWTKFYNEQGYLTHDSVARCGLALTHPFVWPNMERYWRKDKLSKAVFEQSRAAGIQCGYTVPIRGEGFVTLATSSNTLAIDEFPTLQCLAKFAFARFEVLVDTRAGWSATSRRRKPLLFIDQSSAHEIDAAAAPTSSDRPRQRSLRPLEDDYRIEQLAA